MKHLDDRTYWIEVFGIMATLRGSFFPEDEGKVFPGTGVAIFSASASSAWLWLRSVVRSQLDGVASPSEWEAM